jgi:hypothetical protein
MRRVSGGPERRKRPAFEPLDRLGASGAAPVRRRPAATTAGAVLVLLGAAADAVVVATLGASWPALIAEAVGTASADEDARRLAEAGVAAVLVVGALIAAVQVALAILILRGRNWPRVLVMTISTLSISVTFAGWLLGESEIRISGTLLALAFDILILLALSSRDAAAYAHRRRDGEGRR